ncbi:MAG TPA: J domain-containing protein, partial [Pseudomonadaceae bacterium]|nr:J domain-containing protein [Pseudomonadaceae bacterium]
DFSDFFETLFGREGRMRGGFGAGQQAQRRGEDMQAELSLLLEEAWQGCEQILQVRVPELDERGLIAYRTKKLKVKVPAGTTAGSVLRIKGQGAPGMGGAAAGDLLVRIQLAAHPLYTVEGKDVSLVAAILPWEAALGCKITVPSPGKRTRVSVPAGSQTGQKLRLGGLGLPGSPAGDFYVVLKVVMPEAISDKARELYRQLGEEAVPNPRAGWED